MTTLEKHNNMKWLIGFALTVTIAAIFGILVYIAGNAYVYEPLKVHNSVAEPVEVCPGREVFVEYEASTQGGPYTIERTTGQLYWESIDDPRPLGAVVYDIGSSGTDNLFDFVNTTDVRTVDSPVRRVAPTIEGDYFAVSTATVHGKMFGIIPVTQELEITSETLITVVPRSDSMCKDERGGS